ncbi:MAG: hypothetical protein QF486_06705 [Candidatus Woesearchaeota archaeon]|jgi:hypothetical protein|nr:hypothetical protein [Candidatus Woesearchaeota archaeon]MDP7182134.1 hypothetical protein [Candidatus Woesearchaeota archaeon]MDP7199277.1 hypothetical protein [Candidatus Woesearchaeota archaeon]MDP7467898.1 hypothetical protein [Candidatus Woesearchaeota archaeon]MDP7647896.1 hypothetical protein [Candidatus Woesearchaeota archaeon]
MGRTGFVLSVLLLILTLAIMAWTTHLYSLGAVLFTIWWLASSVGLYLDAGWGLPMTIIVLSASMVWLIYDVAVIGGVLLAALLFVTVLAQITCMTTVETA